MRHFNRSSSYSTGLSQSSRQQSLPEIRQFMRSGESTSATIGRRAPQLPLDKSNSRFLKESVQNFLLQEEEEKYEDELARLKLSSEVVESYCDQVCSGHVTSQDKLERIEQHIASFGQQAASLWKKLKKPLQSPSDDSPSEPTPYLNNEVILHFGTILEEYSNALGSYCNNLETQGLLGTYKWSEPGDMAAVSPYLRAEELMNVIQSREYQVKFCHANITHQRKNGVTRVTSSAEADKTVNTGCASNGAASRDESGDIELCMQSLDRSTTMSKLILGVGLTVVVLLIIAVILIIALR